MNQDRSQRDYDEARIPPAVPPTINPNADPLSAAELAADAQGSDTGGPQDPDRPDEIVPDEGDIIEPSTPDEITVERGDVDRLGDAPPETLLPPD